MNSFPHFVSRWYSKTLYLYPRRFQDEFAEEMRDVFRDSMEEAVKDGILSVTFICLRELIGLPFNILREFWHEFRKKETTMYPGKETFSKSNTDELKDPRGAFIGTLPFVLFGIASIIGKLLIPFLGIYVDLAFYAIALLGLLTGLIKGVPRWTYSYLGWSLVFAWWWSNMGTYGLKIFGFQINHWSWQVWPPFFAAIGIALLWTRSLHPLRQLFRGIWQDWTLASIMMYTFVAFMGLIYDENHHPLLFLFMTLSTITISIAAWFYLSSTDIKKKIISLLAGFVLALGITWICDSTWDWYTYYGLPRPAAVGWYITIFRSSIMVLFWGLILFWPALLGLARRAANNRGAA